MGVVEDYLKRGGLSGIAIHTFRKEFKKSEKNTDHPLHVAWKAHQKGHEKKAMALIVTALVEAVSDKNSPLRSCALVLIEIPYAKICLEKGEQGLELGQLPDDFKTRLLMGH